MQTAIDLHHSKPKQAKRTLVLVGTIESSDSVSVTMKQHNNSHQYEDESLESHEDIVSTYLMTMTWFSESLTIFPKDELPMANKCLGKKVWQRCDQTVKCLSLLELSKLIEVSMFEFHTLILNNAALMASLLPHSGAVTAKTICRDNITPPGFTNSRVQWPMDLYGLIRQSHTLPNQRGTWRLIRGRPGMESSHWSQSPLQGVTLTLTFAESNVMRTRWTSGGSITWLDCPIRISSRWEEGCSK